MDTCPSFNSLTQAFHNTGYCTSFLRCKNKLHRPAVTEHCNAICVFWQPDVLSQWFLSQTLTLHLHEFKKTEKSGNLSPDLQKVYQCSNQKNNTSSASDGGLACVHGSMSEPVQKRLRQIDVSWWVFLFLVYCFLGKVVLVRLDKKVFCIFIVGCLWRG